MKRIRDILTRHKTPVSVDDDVTYKQVTIRTNYKGVVLRGSQSGATIGTKNQWRVSAGQFILSRIDARNGAFGIITDELEGAVVTNDFLAFDINEDEVEREFFNVFLQSPVFLDACIKASRGNTNRKRVDETFFLNYEVNLPPLAEQHDLIKRINKGRASVGIAQHEITHQQSLLGKLKQAILQEAIQGKLTAEWRAANPDVEPASQLLKRIQAEKARLIAEKKLRKEKPLPKITPEEIPFEIPEGWAWCRLGDIIGNTDSGWSPACLKNEAPEGRWGVLKTTAVQSCKYLENENKELPPALKSRPETEAKKGDILITRAGPANRVGICCLIRSTRPMLMISDKLVRFRSIVVSAYYVELFAATPQFQTLIESSKQGMAQSQVNISRKNLTATLIPLPPLAEQAAIVERVEALMTTCRALEAEIEQSRTHAAHLLQAVLKEAFAPAGQNAPILNHFTTNSPDPFSVTS
jgi:type I restriction enzyme S subunit